jgi:hypothetical protein
MGQKIGNDLASQGMLRDRPQGSDFLLLANHQHGFLIPWVRASSGSYILEGSDSETVFVNVYGAYEPIPSDWKAIPELPKRSPNAGSGHVTKSTDRSAYAGLVSKEGSSCLTGYLGMNRTTVGPCAFGIKKTVSGDCFVTCCNKKKHNNLLTK